MKKFYLISQKVATVSQLSWSHYVEILKLNDINIIVYYINISIKQNLSVRELRNKIKNNEYERLDDNTKNKLINKSESIITDFIKHPIIIKNKYNHMHITERIFKTTYLLIKNN